MLAAVAHGTLLAFGLILPLGPQNAFVISQGARQPRLARALPIVVAAAFCDTLLILLAVLGVSLVVLTVPGVRTALVGAGVAFLAVVGWLTWRSDPTDKPDAATEAWPRRRQVLFAVSVSLLNPHAILDTVAVIGTSSLAYEGGARAAFTAGCVGVSWAWFLALAAAGRLAGRVPAARRIPGRASAVIMWATALYLAGRLLP
ncbi:MAG TPA: LysE family transporter [Thermodesulfobacteriota bacterium]